MPLGTTRGGEAGGGGYAGGGGRGGGGGVNPEWFARLFGILGALGKGFGGTQQPGQAVQPPPVAPYQPMSPDDQNIQTLLAILFGPQGGGLGRGGPSSYPGGGYEDRGGY